MKQSVVYTVKVDCLLKADVSHHFVTWFIQLR